jgi:DNA-binding NtrC family response regulator
MSQAHPDIIPFPGRPVAQAEQPASILVISANPAQCEELVAECGRLGYPARSTQSLDAAAAGMQVSPADVCVVGQLAGHEQVLALLTLIQQRGWSTQVLKMTHGSPSESLPAEIHAISADCHPTELGLWLRLLSHTARSSGEIRRLKRQLSNRNLRDMVGQSPAMQLLRQQVQLAAEHTHPLLLCAETGAGADLVAQGIHDAGKRSHRPFVSIDCSVHSAETLEQELFGTAAPQGSVGAGRQPGRLEQADGGTLLLEEVQTMALPLQKHLAQVFADQRFEVPGTGERVRFDVRIILSTQADLAALRDRGLYRDDLLPESWDNQIAVPSLRSRPEDIAALAEAALKQQAAREGRPTRSLTLDALHQLQAHAWPGNIRELNTVIERACSVDCGRKLTGAMLAPWLASASEADVPAGLTLAEMEKRLIEATFTRFAGNRERTAKALQIGIRTLSGKLREYGYPPRGGPGSNLKPWSPAAEDVTPLSTTWEQRAA